MKCSSAEYAIPGRRRARRGFTLLEVLVALLIAAGGFGAVLAGLAGAQRAGQRADEARRELEVARALVEEAFLGVLPQDSYIGRAEKGGDEWKGERSGVEWTVRVLSTATRGMNTVGSNEPLGGRVSGVVDPSAEILLEMRLIQVRAGRVDISTVQW